ncbi:two-component sensor histidine kinase [Bifidobacterium callitrichos]|uniref:histidine kinase n=1 Tax=Bifidobacterium callitrichos TaxID=762209 RepID=A0A2T3GAN3_9BIFI|nr:HAMP domain-containing sensor histidine kinase [Bifidobacterium callitrichos]PST46538.1 two-component sensor histidine kinase [Bifidobacterium callitrichos]
MTRNRDHGHDRPPAKARTRIRDRIARSLRRVADRLTPRTFRAKLTIAISIVFLIALGSAAIVQTAIINGMFSYAMTISYENGQDRQSDGDDSAEGTPSDDDFLSVEGWSAGSLSGTQQQPDADDPLLLGSSSNGKGEGSVTGRTNGEPYYLDWGGDGSFTITTPYGISIWNRDAITNGLRISAVVIFVFFGVTSILVIWIVTSRMSRRLKSISEQTAALDPSDLGTRIDTDRTGRVRGGDEITSLGASINGMLDRIQAASEAERRFVSNASHELRTPIAAVETNLDAPLTQGRFPEDVAPSVRRALAANRRGAELVDALLTLSRIQSGAYGKLAPTASTAGDGKRQEGMTPADASGVRTTDLTACVNDALADMDRDIDERRISVTVDVADGVTVGTDTALMRLAVGNLIRNAVVHNTDGGSVTVSIDATGDGEVALTVANTTDERLPDDLDDLVQPFHRGVNSRISAVSGVGLGLSIADAACTAMGARLRLSKSSKVEKSSFTATITGLSAVSSR